MRKTSDVKDIIKFPFTSFCYILTAFVAFCCLKCLTCWIKVSLVTVSLEDVSCALSACNIELHFRLTLQTKYETSVQSSDELAVD